METLHAVPGSRHTATIIRATHESGAFDSIHAAIHAGFAIGCDVHLGQVTGQVVGYNIGGYGRYTGVHYPLLVRTEFGLAKCSLSEVSLH